MKIKNICILGGTGFVGQHLAARLAFEGYSCRIVSRHPQRYRALQVLPAVELVQAHALDTRTLERIFADCDAVINLIGILNEAGKEGTFRHIHVELVDRVVDACRSAGVPRLMHMSALNANAGSGVSQYLRTRGEGENRAHTRGGASAAVTSFRPSVIFGPGDSFFNRFADLLQLAPGLFPLACPDARFAPVFVGDVVAAFSKSLQDKATFGRHYDLCGPRVFTLKELVQYTAKTLGRGTRVIGLGNFGSRMQARALEILPGKPFSYDNYLSMQIDSLCGENGLEELGIHPTDIDTVVPAFLGSESQRQRYQELRTDYWGFSRNDSRRV